MNEVKETKKALVKLIQSLEKKAEKETGWKKGVLHDFCTELIKIKDIREDE